MGIEQGLQDFKEMEDGQTALSFLMHNRIFNVEVMEDKAHVIFQEECDSYFTTILSKKQLAMLISELQTMHDEMI